MLRSARSQSLLLGVSLLTLGLGAFESRASRKTDFAHDVLPILKAHCFSCHGDESRAGGLDLRTYETLMKGGASGPAVKAKGAKDSLLVNRILGIGGERMPMGFAPLEAKKLATIRAWIDEGALPSNAGEKKAHWAFVAPVKPALPKVSDPKWVRNPIDAFVLARLDREKLKPSSRADKTTLIRRLTLDLTGLPPTPAEVDAFNADQSPDAYEKVVDRLLASPHFGERMALPWLDAARYADSNGFQQDGDNYQYVWRDWVVRAYNSDMPFDQFTVEQVAGDLLPKPTLDQVVATAFNRNHMLNGEGGAIAEEQRNVVLFDRVDVTSTTWLALTMACARCHDHKYDPVSQRDYYSLMAYFNNVPESGVPPGGGQYRIADPWVYAAPETDLAKLERLKEAKDRAEAAAKAQPDSPDPKSLAEAAQREYTSHEQSLPRVMVMSDAQPRKTYVLSRGDYEKPLEEVAPRTPDVLPPLPKTAPSNRLALARWLIAKDNPLTARVAVNRLWQQFFGQGLVKTSENFGIQGEVPSHPELLDWLAVDFRESGWKVKRLVKLLVMSATYRQSSKATPEAIKRDPDNRLLARGARFRLPSLILRDVALASSGLLNAEIGGKPVYPYQPPGIWDGLAITKERDFTYPQSHGPDLYRRSLYTFWRRTAAPGNMFDSANRQACTVRASVTSTPLHALTTLNDVTWVEASRVLAESVLKGCCPANQFSEVFRRVCARRPSTAESRVLKRAYERSLAEYTRDRKSALDLIMIGESKADPKLDPAKLAALTTVCLAVYNLDEALTRE